MPSLRLFGHQLYDLAATTVLVWWRLLPQLLIIQLIGAAAIQISQLLAAVVAGYAIWPSMAILAAGFVVQLIAYVISLRLVGAELGMEHVIGAEAAADNRAQSTVQILAATLLPFLGIYAAFDYVREAAGQMYIVAQYMSGGALGDNVLTEANPLENPQTLALTIGLLVGIYLVRRALDLSFSRLGWRVFGLLAAFLEACFLLILVFSGQRLVEQFVLWWRDRAFFDWIDTGVAALAKALEPLRIDLPEFLGQLASLLATAWGFLWAGVLEPLAWLAVAALVFGTHVLSLADMWRRGQPLVTKALPRSRLVRSVADGRSRGLGRRAWLEVQEAFFGDIDDRYLPTLQSIRIVLRPGLTFLAAYVLLYAVLYRGANLLLSVLIDASGGQPFPFWVAWLPALNIIVDLAYQPLFVCLLAVTFHRCLAQLRGLGYAKTQAVRPGRAPAGAVRG